MRIVFPDGAGCVQSPADLEPLRPRADFKKLVDQLEQDAKAKGANGKK